MGLINWIFDIYQHSKIDDARAEASAARAEIAAYRQQGGGAASSDPSYEQALGELALATKTLQRMMVERQLCSSQDFYALLHQIDLEDGKADGKAPI